MLQKLINLACDNIDVVLHTLKINNYFRNDKIVLMSCPIHHGDNPTALNLYTHGDSVRGYWQCNTHQCHQQYPKNLLGFIQGVLSQQHKQRATYNQSIQWLLKLFEYKHLSDVKYIQPNIKKINRTKLISKPSFKMDRTYFRNNLIIPSQYYINKDFSASLLDTYDVGFSNKINRTIIPIYDNQHKFIIGYNARTIYPKHNKCGQYHPVGQKCPETMYEFACTAKWKCSKGLKKENCLFNYWFASKEIIQQNNVILVESIGNVLRLVQNGIKNVVGILGSSLSDNQQILLNTLGVTNVTLLLDNDKAGINAVSKIYTKLKTEFNVCVINLPLTCNDVCDMSNQDVKSIIIPQIQRNIL